MPANVYHHQFCINQNEDRDRLEGRHFLHKEYSLVFHFRRSASLGKVDPRIKRFHKTDAEQQHEYGLIWMLEILCVCLFAVGTFPVTGFATWFNPECLLLWRESLSHSQSPQTHKCSFTNVFVLVSSWCWLLFCTQSASNFLRFFQHHSLLKPKFASSKSSERNLLCLPMKQKEVDCLK